MTLKNAHHLREKAKKFHRDFEAEPLKEGEIKCAGRRPGYDCNHTNQSSYYWHPLGVCGACFQYLYRTRQLGRDGSTAFFGSVAGDLASLDDFADEELKMG